MKSTDPNWASYVQEPLIVDEPESLSWADAADVVVVGFGNAGACAAIDAAERDAEVIALDRFSGGGATSLSGGVYYGGGGTEFQRAAGVDDTPEAFYQYLSLQTKNAVRDETLRCFCRENPINLKWLIAHGVRFSGALEDAKTTYPRQGKYLYYSGNERLSGYKEYAKPAARGHRAFVETHPIGLTGYAYFDALRSAALSAGVRVLDHTPVTRLIVDKYRNVIGVEVNAMLEENGAKARHRVLAQAFKPLHPLFIAKRRRIQRRLELQEKAEGTRLRIRARKGVILSTGGFIHNWDMVEGATNIDHKFTVRMGSPGCDGSGIRLGQSVGGAISKMSHFDIGRGLNPSVFVKGMLVNPEGKRFLNEESYSGTIGDTIVNARYARVWLIVDKWIRSAAIRAAMPGQGRSFFFFGMPTLLNLLIGGGKKARSIEALASKLGMPCAVLKATLESYNAAAEGSFPDEFGKAKEEMRPLSCGPYYAIDFSVSNRFAPMLAFTLGGLVVDEATGGVKREDGSTIGGLYAAGRTAIGVCSNSYVSGMSLADGVFSGRRAAHSVVGSTRS
jgi:3-oxo-5alpha-steroid 4-dehydrogenase